VPVSLAAGWSRKAGKAAVDRNGPQWKVGEDGRSFHSVARNNSNFLSQMQPAL
jgi:hypothetical protein